MKRLILIFALALSLMGCMPSVVQLEEGYQVTLESGDLAVIGASEPILYWEPFEVCERQSTFRGEDRALVCTVPSDVFVAVARSADGALGKISVQYYLESGFPAGFPR